MKSINFQQEYFGACDRCHKNFPNTPLILVEGRLFCKVCVKFVLEQIQEIKLGDTTKILIELDISEHLSSVVTASQAAHQIIKDCDFLSLPREQRISLVAFARELATELSRVDHKKWFSVTNAIQINRTIKQKLKASEKSKKENETPKKRGRKKDTQNEFFAKLGLDNVEELIAQARKNREEKNDA